MEIRLFFKKKDDIETIENVLSYQVRGDGLLYIVDDGCEYYFVINNLLSFLVIRN